MSYAPLAGSVADRALSWLRAQEMAVSTPVLAASIECDAVDVHNSLVPAVKHGLVAREMRQGRCYWSVGSGEPTPQEEPDEAPMVQRVVSANGVRAIANPLSWRPPEPPAASRPAPTPAPVPLPAGPIVTGDIDATAAPACDSSTSAARFALWSDGHLEVDAGPGARFVLTIDDTKALIHYLDRLVAGDGA